MRKKHTDLSDIDRDEVSDMSAFRINVDPGERVKELRSIASWHRSSGPNILRETTERKGCGRDKLQKYPIDEKITRSNGRSVQNNESRTQ